MNGSNTHLHFSTKVICALVRRSTNSQRLHNFQQMQFNVSLDKVNISGGAAQRSFEHAHFGQDHIQLGKAGNSQSRRNHTRKRTVWLHASAHAQASSASPRMYF